MDRPTESRNPRARSLSQMSTRQILELINEHTSTLIFVNDRAKAERVAAQVNASEPTQVQAFTNLLKKYIATSCVRHFQMNR